MTTTTQGASAELRTAIKLAGMWAAAEHEHARNLGRGGPGKIAKVEKAEAAARAAIEALAAQPAAPVVPEGYVLVPKRLTAENGAKGALSGEFKESVTVTCHECGGSGDDAESDNDAECAECKGDGTLEQDVPVTWDTIKAIYVAAVELLAASPQVEVAPQAEQVAKLPVEPTRELLIACGWEKWKSGSYVDMGQARAIYDKVREAALAEATQPSTAPTERAAAPADLPTNDEVYAEVNRQRDAVSNIRYVSTNAVNDTMAAVRALIATRTAEAADQVGPQICGACGGDGCEQCGGYGDLLGGVQDVAEGADKRDAEGGAA